MKRRIAPDEKGRAPFAVLAVMIFLLSSFSVAYLGATTRRGIVNRLLESDLRAIGHIESQIRDELHSSLYVVCVKALYKFLEETDPLTPENEPADMGSVNTSFQELLDDFFLRYFPRRIKGYLVEESGYLVGLLPKIERTLDLMPRGFEEVEIPRDYGVHNYSKINTTRSEVYGQTNTSYSYLAMGYVNISVKSNHNLPLPDRTLWIKKEVDVPLPFLLGKMDTFQSNSVGSFSDVPRLTKYILTTIAQSKAFQGYGMKSSSLPLRLLNELKFEGNDATEVLTVKDVELAVNLALLLESAKTFRTWDYQVSEHLHDLLLEYSTQGTIDGADLATLYLGNEGNLNFEIILSQAIYGVLDQFILKYLDYSGLMPFVDQIWKEVQTIDGILQQAGEEIRDILDWFLGTSTQSWDDILENWLGCTIVESGGLETDFFLRLLVGDRHQSKYRQFDGKVIDSFPEVNIHEGGYNLEFVVRQTDEYHTWYSNGSESPHRIRHHLSDAITGYDHSILTVEVEFGSSNHEVVFEEVNIRKADHSSSWRKFFDMYFDREQDERSSAESIREQIREMVLEISLDVVRRVDDSLNDMDFFVVNPSDSRPYLTELRQGLESVMDEVARFYRSSAGKEELRKIASSHVDDNFGLVEDLKHYLASEYDNFVDSASIIQSGTESLSSEILENHMHFNIADLDVVENTNVDFDWTFDGNVTEDAIPPNEISRVFREGGANTPSKFSNLLGALTDDVDSAYQQMKRREVALGGIQAAKGVLTQVLEAAGEKVNQDILSLIVGGTTDFFDGVGLIDMAMAALENFSVGMLEGFEASNVQYLLPFRVGEPFEFWKGDYNVASETNSTETVSLQVDQLVNYIPVEWNNIDHLTSVPDGILYTDFNPGGSKEGDQSYDSGDIRGKHYTDILTFSERPFETKWNLSVLGSVPICVRTNERVLLGPRGRQPIWLNKSIEINFSISIVVYTGWELEGVDYDLTSNLLSDIADFLANIWETIGEPIMDTIDYFQILSDFLRDLSRTILEYGHQVVKVIADATDFAVTLLQSFVSDVLTIASDFILSFLKDFSLEHFFVEFAGFTFEVKLTSGREREECQCRLWIRARGDIIGLDLDFTTYLVEFEQPTDGIERYLTIEGHVRFDHNGIANVTIDPLILTHPYLVEMQAVNLNSQGDGWTLELFSPEIDIYKSSGVSLSEIIGFVPAIPIPVLGVEIGVDFGVGVKHLAPDPGSPTFDFRLVMGRMLKESFSEAWQEIEMSYTLNFIEAFIETTVNKFISKLSNKLEESIIEVVVFLNLKVSVMGSGGTVGGGFRLGLVVDRDVIIEMLHWIVDTVGTFVENINSPFDQYPYMSVPEGLSAHLGVRFEAYFGVDYPRMLSKLSHSDAALKKMDMAISVQPSVPALMILGGVDWGKWKIDFGVYLADFPLSSLSKVYTLSKGSTADFYLLKGQISEVCGSCQ